jgi:carbon-monoxide dehydrogenase medium subunit
MHIAGRDGERTTPIGAFLQGMMATSLADGEILTAIEVAKGGAGHGTAYVKFSHPASHYAVLGVAAVVGLKNGTCTDARVAIGGLLPAAKRLPGVEQTLVGQHITAEHVSQAAARAGADLGGDVLGDIYASAEYRTAMAPVYVGRALRLAFERAA